MLFTNDMDTYFHNFVHVSHCTPQPGKHRAGPSGSTGTGIFPTSSSHSCGGSLSGPVTLTIGIPSTVGVSSSLERWSSYWRSMVASSLVVFVPESALGLTASSSGRPVPSLLGSLTTKRAVLKTSRARRVLCYCIHPSDRSRVYPSITVQTRAAFSRLSEPFYLHASLNFRGLISTGAVLRSRPAGSHLGHLVFFVELCFSPITGLQRPNLALTLEAKNIFGLQITVAVRRLCFVQIVSRFECCG